MPILGEISSVSKETKKKGKNLTTENFRLEKLTLPFGSGELKSKP